MELCFPACHEKLRMRASCNLCIIPLAFSVTQGSIFNGKVRRLCLLRKAFHELILPNIKLKPHQAADGFDQAINHEPITAASFEPQPMDSGSRQQRSAKSSRGLKGNQLGSNAFRNNERALHVSSSQQMTFLSISFRSIYIKPFEKFHRWVGLREVAQKS